MISQKGFRFRRVRSAFAARGLRWAYAILWIFLCPGYFCIAADETERAKEVTARYFSSPREAVSRINELLRDQDWKTLSDYYDLSGSSVDRRELESGRFFIRTERPEKADPAGFWRYRHPFPPGFVFHHEQSTDDPNLIVVVVGIEINQGGGMRQRAFSEFKIKKSPNGYQILP
jgi:hypothetical protein